MNADDLVPRLLTLAGAIMEDTSAVAILGTAPERRQHAAAEVRAAADDLQSLAAAIDVAIRRTAT